MQFDARQKATLLAALHYWRDPGLPQRRLCMEVATNRGEIPMLDDAEVEMLSAYIDNFKASTDLSLTIPDAAWQMTGRVGGDDNPEPDDTPESRLLCSDVKINGLGMHVEAFEVKRVPHAEGNLDYEEQRATNSMFDDELERYHSMQDTEFKTTEIMGRTYIICATPHGD